MSQHPSTSNISSKSMHAFWVILLTDRQTNEHGQKHLPPLSEVTSWSLLDWHNIYPTVHFLAPLVGPLRRLPANAQCSARDRLPALCKISAKSVQQFRGNRQTDRQTDRQTANLISPITWWEIKNTSIWYFQHWAKRSNNNWINNWRQTFAYFLSVRSESGSTFWNLSMSSKLCSYL